MNRWIHPRNPYKDRVDFKALASKHPELLAILNPDGKLDFGVRENGRILAKVLLKQDFGLNIDFPKDSLSPSLTLKFNYLLFIQDVLRENGLDDEEVAGIDVGTGGAILFPALAVRHFNWQMVGTESNEDDYRLAVSNSLNNGLQGRLEIVKNPLHRQILHPAFDLQSTVSSFAFSMCNPPFYSSLDDVQDTPLPGRSHEMVTDGGEVSFVANMIAESEELKDKVKIFTTMLGHKKNVSKIKGMLRRNGRVCSFVATEFCQGRIMRWAVAWTFQSQLSLLRSSEFAKAKVRKRNLENPFVVCFPSGCGDAERVLRAVRSWLQEDLEAEAVRFERLPTQPDSSLIRFQLFTPAWRNQRAKRRSLATTTTEPKRRKRDGDDDDDALLLLDVRLSVTCTNDRTLFEFACGGGGSLGRGGLYELVQFFRNKLTAFFHP